MKRLNSQWLAKSIMWLLGINRLNRAYSTLMNSDGQSLDELLQILDLQYEVTESDLKRIPLKGAFLTVSNHPFGGADGIILAHLISGVRPDFKILANFLLSRIAPLAKYFIPLNPFEEYKNSGMNLTGLRGAFTHLHDGGPIGLFPAGEVSSIKTRSFRIQDKAWQDTIIRFVKKTAVPVLPIYFDGFNSKRFYFFGLIHPRLRTILIPRELFTKSGRKIKIRIGNPIPPSTISEMESIKDIRLFLRNATYNLRLIYKEKEIFAPLPPHFEEEIIPPISEIILKKEVESLNEHLLFSVKDYDVFCTQKINIPNIMAEIGRLRETTYRDVGEGTSKKTDLDRFDEYFHQLFIWDNINYKIVGAYRIGLGREIIAQHGLEGFYINSLFYIDKSMEPIMTNALELGRSFIVKEYQRKAMPLFMLWKGLFALLLKHDYRYLIGPVSISGKFSNVSKALVSEFLKAFYFNQEVAPLIKNRVKTQIKLDKEIDKESFLKATNGDFAKLDKYIQSIDPSYTTPVLVKQYVSMLNTRAIGFNVDPEFNNCLDALMMINITEAPKQFVESLSKDMKDTKLDKLLEELQ
ncbi:MAG: lysophospholipid acyltransferase family protein [Bacteroidales bacterium]|nr:lysophospholipid acyltransferase family protein [Bacteroidales bacterium]